MYLTTATSNISTIAAITIATGTMIATRGTVGLTSLLLLFIVSSALFSRCISDDTTVIHSSISSITMLALSLSVEGDNILS